MPDLLARLLLQRRAVKRDGMTARCYVNITPHAVAYPWDTYGTTAARAHHVAIVRLTLSGILPDWPLTQSTEE